MGCCLDPGDVGDGERQSLGSQWAHGGAPGSSRLHPVGNRAYSETSEVPAMIPGCFPAIVGDLELPPEQGRLSRVSLICPVLKMMSLRT